MSKNTVSKAWSRPKLKVLGTMADVAGNGNAACQGQSTCSTSRS